MLKVFNFSRTVFTKTIIDYNIYFDYRVVRGNKLKVSIYNTLTRKVEELDTITPGRVKLYTCGPTVYNYAHIGNLRTYVFEDILRRTLEAAGSSVKHVMNVTDVGHLTSDGDDGEDKMIQSAREKGMSVWDIARFFEDAFFSDTKKLNIFDPVVSCRATEHIDDMIQLVQRIEANGYAYTADGNVYFDTEKFTPYGRMAQLEKQDLKQGQRVAVDSAKKHPRDFVLWFTNSKFAHQAMQWDSPWGKGYPGWHLECSAMSMKYLGEQFDIHCGGVDHINVHHTNEIAQSEAATGKKWVNYWMHGEFLVMKTGKMSKSSGGFITLENLVEDGFDPLDYRYFCLGAHYRSQLVFSRESLESARNARNNLKRRIVPLRNVKTAAKAGAAQGYLDEFYNQAADDLNMPRCLGSMWGLLQDENVPDAEKKYALLRMDEILAVGIDEKLHEAAVDLPPEARKLIVEREKARERRDYARSDQLRDELLAQGISVKDSPEGTDWEFVQSV